MHYLYIGIVYVQLKWGFYQVKLNYLSAKIGQIFFRDISFVCTT